MRIKISVTPIALVCLLLTTAGCDVLETGLNPIELTFDGQEVTSGTVIGSRSMILPGGAVILDIFFQNNSGEDFESTSINLKSITDKYSVSYAIAREIDGHQIASSDFTLANGQTLRLGVAVLLKNDLDGGTKIPLKFILNAANVRGIAETSFTTDALPYNPRIGALTVVSDTDGDGKPEPGETVRLTFPIESEYEMYENRCLIVVEDIQSQLSGVTRLGTLVASTCSNRSFDVRISQTVQIGAVASFQVQIKDALGNSFSRSSVQFTVQ